MLFRGASFGSGNVCVRVGGYGQEEIALRLPTLDYTHAAAVDFREVRYSTYAERQSCEGK
jgi:hypothetical protein